MPATTAAARRSSPSWWRGSSAPPCWASSVRPAAASRRSCVLGCWRRWRTACSPGSERWLQRLIRPGEHPLRRGDDQVTDDLAGAERYVLAVDQCEELFTACRDPQERSAFVDALVALDARARWRSRCARTTTAAAPSTPRWRARSPPTTCSSARCSARSCGRRSSAPRRLAGLSVEPELVDALVADVEGGRARFPCFPPRCLSSGSTATGAACATRPMSAAAACAAPLSGRDRNRSRSVSNSQMLWHESMRSMATLQSWNGPVPSPRVSLPRERVAGRRPPRLEHGDLLPQRSFCHAVWPSVRPPP